MGCDGGRAAEQCNTFYTYTNRQAEVRVYGVCMCVPVCPGVLVCMCSPGHCMRQHAHACNTYVYVYVCM
jgi:hypothetical protein